MLFANNPFTDQDSFRTFEEILELAKKNDVDFVLLGGDLFHDCQPSAHCMQKCTELLKKYVIKWTIDIYIYISNTKINTKKNFVKRECCFLFISNS